MIYPVDSAIQSLNNRGQNNRGDVSQSENTDVTRTDKTDWTIPILLSLLFVVVIWNGKLKYLWQIFRRPSRLLETFFKKLKFLERNGILIVDADIPRFIKQRRLYQFS